MTKKGDRKLERMLKNRETEARKPKKRKLKDGDEKK